VVLCSGKVYFDLLKAREEQKRQDVAILRVERLYPFPSVELEAALLRYPQQASLAWCQEEPRNMGAWRFAREQFLDGRVLGSGRTLQYAGRAESASPAAGSLKVHTAEQDALVKQALG
jgi:2-oxoglutarate dehydrogenase E1 component